MPQKTKNCPICGGPKYQGRRSYPDLCIFCSRDLDKELGKEVPPLDPDKREAIAHQKVLAWCQGEHGKVLRKIRQDLCCVLDTLEVEPDPRYARSTGFTRTKRIASGATWLEVALQLGLEVPA